MITLEQIAKDKKEAELKISEILKELIKDNDIKIVGLEIDDEIAEVIGGKRCQIINDVAIDLQIN